MAKRKQNSRPVIIAANVRAKRARLEWNQGKLAMKVGCSQATISRIEKAIAKDLDRWLPSVAKALSMSIEEIETVLWN